MIFETFNKRHALRLIKDGAEVKRTAERGGQVYWTLSMPRRWFKWPRKPRVLSEAQQAIAKERGAALQNRILGEKAKENAGSGE